MHERELVACIIASLEAPKNNGMREFFDDFFCIYTHSVGTVFFSALSISMAIVVLHGAFREPDNLFIDEAAEVR